MRSRLSGLTFTDPQADPAWTHAVVPGTAGPELPAAPRAVEVEVAGAGQLWSLTAWVEATSSTSLLVVADGAVVHEWYADGLGPDTAFLGASMTKSVLAHLVGRAVAAGALAVTDAVIDHVPELRGTGYDAASVLDVLTMTTGVDWVEDHRDPDSLASRLVGSFSAGGDSRALLAQVRPGVAPGIRFSYCTADSQVLDWVRERATGRAYAEDVALLWQELGATHDAYVVLDGAGVAMAGGGLAATARDWARVAIAAATDTAWAEAAARPAYPFLAPGRLPSSITTHAGFGYHWWPLDDDGVRVTADGSRGQFACADRRTGAVVVKTSLWPYEDFLVDRQARDLSYLGLHALLDAVAAATPEKAPEKAPQKESTP